MSFGGDPPSSRPPSSRFHEQQSHPQYQNPYSSAPHLNPLGETLVHSQPHHQQTDHHVQYTYHLPQSQPQQQYVPQLQQAFAPSPRPVQISSGQYYSQPTQYNLPALPPDSQRFPPPIPLQAQHPPAHFAPRAEQRFRPPPMASASYSRHLSDPTQNRVEGGWHGSGGPQIGQQPQLEVSRSNSLLDAGIVPRDGRDAVTREPYGPPPTASPAQSFTHGLHSLADTLGTQSRTHFSDAGSQRVQNSHYASSNRPQAPVVQIEASRPTYTASIQGGEVSPANSNVSRFSPSMSTSGFSTITTPSASQVTSRNAYSPFPSEHVGGSPAPSWTTAHETPSPQLKPGYSSSAGTQFGASPAYHSPSGVMLSSAPGLNAAASSLRQSGLAGPQLFSPPRNRYDTQQQVTPTESPDPLNMISPPRNNSGAHVAQSRQAPTYAGGSPQPRKRKLEERQDPSAMAPKPVKQKRSPGDTPVVVIPVRRSPPSLQSASSKVSVNAKTKKKRPTPPKSEAEVSRQGSATAQARSTAPKPGSSLHRVSYDLEDHVIPDSQGTDADEMDLFAMPLDTPEKLGRVGMNQMPSSGSSGSRTATGPVKGGDSKNAVVKLTELMEDIFEAQDSLPDRDTLLGITNSDDLPTPADGCFDVISGSPILKEEVLLKLLKLTRMGARRATATSSEAKGTASRLADVSADDFARLLRLVEPSLRSTDTLSFFAASAKATATTPVSPKKKSPLKRQSPAGTRSRSRSRSPSKTPSRGTPMADDQMDEDEDKEDIEKSATQPLITAGEDEKVEADERDQDEVFNALGSQLDTLSYGVLAAEFCLTLLAGDELPKRLLSEELIHASVEVMKLSLEKVILPFVEACGSINVSPVHPDLELLVNAIAPPKAKGQRASNAAKSIPPSALAVSKVLGIVSNQTCSALWQFQKLVALPHLSISDSIVVSAMYISLGPFFAMEPEPTSSGTSDAAKTAARGRAAMAALGGQDAMKNLRLPALNLLRTVFARHPHQRQGIVEEILASLINLPDLKKNRRQHGLRTGKAINSVNALLIQLVQTAAHSPTSDDVAIDLHVNLDNLGGEDGDAPANSHQEVSPQARAAKGLEGSDRAATSIASYLIQRAGQTKVTKSSTETSYASIIDNLITDLLSTMFLPEWPAAAMLVSRFCSAFAATLEDPKTSQDIKGLALEHLGSIAAHIRENDVTRLKEDHLALSSLTKLESDWNVTGLNTLDQSYKAVFHHLARAEEDDQASRSASEFLAAQWAFELSLSLSRTSLAAEDAGHENAAAEVISAIHFFRASVQEALNATLSKQPYEAGDIFDTVSKEDYERVSQLYSSIMPTCTFMVTSEFAVGQLIMATGISAVGNRSRAIRGLSSINAVDPTLLDQFEVRSAIESRLVDASTSVRENAVSLLGKYVLRDPQHIMAYYEQLAGRIYDSGLAVRKRVLGLLARMFATVTDQAIRTDACVRIIRCVNDEDSGMQDLAVATIADIWLGMHIPLKAALTVAASADDSAEIKPTKAKVAQKGAATPEHVQSPGADDAQGDVVPEGAAEEKSSTVAEDDRATIIMSAAGLIRERPSPLEEVFRRLMSKCSGRDADNLLTRLRNLTNSMIDSLVETTDASISETFNRVKTVYLLTSTNPAVLSVGKAKLLLPYLKGIQSQEDLLIPELLFKVFRACLPHMPRTALSFADALEKSLTPLVSKPPMKPASASMQELVACYCTVVRTHTHNYKFLIRVFAACMNRFKAVCAKVQSDATVKLDHVSAQIMSLCSLLCEHGNFDAIAEENAECKADLAKISTKSMTDTLSEMLIGLYNSPNTSFRSSSLQCLGFIFRSHPSLMVKEGATTLMDGIFAGDSTYDRELLLKIFHEYLSSPLATSGTAATQVAPITASTKVTPGKLDMSELVGNTDTFAESGIASSLLQHYLDPILAGARQIGQPVIQRTASEILKFVVMQGLAHPFQCVPTLIALETVDDPNVAGRALHLHSHLASKHGSILAARYLDLSKAAFNFQLEQTSFETLRGFHAKPSPTAHFHAWYSLVRDRRQTRLDFLKAVIKAMDVDVSSEDCSENDVAFARYIGDNLASLEYKTLEEIFVVIHDLRAILAVSGVQVLHLAQEQLHTPPSSAEANAAGILREAVLAESGEMIPDSQDNSIGQATESALQVARTSVVMGTALLVRAHLKAAYNLSEAKCAKYDPGKRTSGGADRPAVRKTLLDPSSGALSFESMPLALRQIRTATEAQEQLTTYEDLINNEGVLNEPEDVELE